MRPRNRETTILIADDDSAILTLIADVLRQNQFAVVTASDGAQALARARAHRETIDLLLTDFDMPHLNGVQLATEVRQFLPDIMVVVMSGSPNKEAAAGSVTKFLKKPFTAPMLLEMIDALLRSRCCDRDTLPS
jgi:CheY-like chemotaxis protein